MSSSEARPAKAVLPRFRVRALDRHRAVSRDTRVTVYDGRDEIVKEAMGEASLELPRGLYTVRLERAGLIEETILRHDTGTEKDLPAPLRASATPVFDTATTHEYYAYTSAEWSAKDTRSPIGAPGLATNGRLFVFLRTLDAQSYKQENLAEGLRLLDWQGAQLSSFDDAEVQKSNDGWLALSARCPAGSYLLRYESESAREMPLYVYPERSTQLFVSYAGWRSKGRTTQGRLQFETAAILMPHVDESFNPDDSIAQAVDLALAGLQQGRNYLPADELNVLLDGKIENPLLGLLGAHALLQRDAQEPRLDLVIRRLGDLLPGSPDVQALSLILAELRGQAPRPEPFERPPMLRRGLEALLRASARQPDLVPEDGLVERVATRLRVDSPWSSWEPELDLLDVAAPMASTAEDLVRQVVRKAFERAETRTADWLSSYLRDAMNRSRKTNRQLDVERLATQVGVPRRVLERKLSAIDVSEPDAAPSSDLTQIKGVGPVFQQVLKDLGYRTYADLAKLEKVDVERIGERLGRHAGRLVKDAWIDQARKLGGGDPEI